VRTAATPPAALRPILGTPDRLLFHLAVRHPQLSSASGLAGPPVPAQWGQATTLEQDFDLTQLRWTVHATTAFFRAVQADPGLMPPLLRRRGVTDVLRFRAGVHRQGDTLALPPGVTSPLELVPVEGSQPFAFAAHRLERVAGDVGWLEAVRRLGEEAARTACVDPGDAGPGAGAALAGVPLAPAPASVRVMDRGAGRVELEVDAAQPGPAFVAINQTWDEGWQTTLDDHPVPLVRTDIDLSGLVVPAGKHRVLLVYRERAVQLGLAMSLLAALVCLGLVFVGRSRRVRAAGS
jgi:hypothetical protein